MSDLRWKQRARNARLSNGFIASALGYSNPAKVSQAFGWDEVPASIRLFIVLAERVSPSELETYIAELSTSPTKREGK